jgi:chemotaxis protein histidine kinase CheA
MDFRDLAAKETSKLITSVVGASQDASREKLAAMRTAMEAAAKALEASLAAPPAVEKAVADLAARLGKTAEDAAHAAAQRVAVEAKATTDTLRGELAAEKKEKEALAATVKQARTDTDGLRAQLERQAAQMKDAQARLEAATTELKAEKQRVEAARRELADARETGKKLEAARAQAVTARDEEATARTRLEEALNAAHSQAQAAEAKVGAVTSLFKASASRVTTLERAAKDTEQTIRDLQARLQAAESREAAPAAREMPALSTLEDLLGSFNALNGATTIGDVLTTLTEQLAAEFPRIALFRLKGNRLQGEHQIGFDLKTEIAKVVMPLGMDSLLSRAVASGRVERLGEGDDTHRVPFGGDPTFALAVPIVVQSETLAVLYADDSGAAEATDAQAGEVRLKIAEALVQHAVALLMRLTTELRTLAELGAYATSLVAEIEQMYDSDVAAGKDGKELQERLKANVEYARSIYANRVAFDGPGAATLLDDQLAASIDERKGKPFGRDLSVVVGGAAGRAERAAEAS